MGLDPAVLAAINTFALATIVVLLVTGLLVAKPSYDFVVRMLDASLSRETKLGEAVAANTATMRETINELRERKAPR